MRNHAALRGYGIPNPNASAGHMTVSLLSATTPLLVILVAPTPNRPLHFGTGEQHDE